MRRLGIGVGIGVVCLVMAGLVALIVARVATYDSGDGTHAFTIRCPARPVSSAALGDRNANSESDEATVPDGADRLLLCRYGSGTDAPGPAVGERVLRDRPEIDEIAAGLNHLTPYIEEAHSCPSADAELKIDAIFGYPDAPPVLVEVQPHGCTSVDNGRAGGGYADGAVLRRLEALVRARGVARPRVARPAFPPSTAAYDLELMSGADEAHCTWVEGTENEYACAVRVRSRGANTRVYKPLGEVEEIAISRCEAPTREELKRRRLDGNACPDLVGAPFKG